MKALYVNPNVENFKTPHVCGEGETACLACELIRVLGESRKNEALEIAARIASGGSEAMGWHSLKPAPTEEVVAENGMIARSIPGSFGGSLNISIPDDAWEICGSEEDPSSRLLINVVINSADMHVEAYAVKEDEYGVLVADDPSFEDAVERFHSAAGTDGGSFTITTIKGREYAVVAYPFCS